MIVVQAEQIDYASMPFIAGNALEEDDSAILWHIKRNLPVSIATLMTSRLYFV